MGKSRWKKKELPFAMIYKHMLATNAWRQLSNPARVAYIHLKAKYNGQNAKNLSLTYNEMQPFMCRRTFRNAIKQLVEYGFIEIVNKGGLMRNPNIYALTDGWNLDKNEA